MDKAQITSASRRRNWLRTFCGLLILVLANLGAAFLPEEIDLTRSRAHSLAPQTKNLLAHLTSPIEITLLVPREPKSTAEREFAQAAVMFRELVGLCRQATTRIRLEELDPESNAEARQVLQRFPDVTPPCVLLRLEDADSEAHEILYARDLASVFRSGSERAPVVEFFGEQALTAALTRLTSGRKRTVIYVLTGHGELSLDDDAPHSRRGLGILGQRLERLDIELRPLDLSRSERVPRDADLVLIAGGEAPLGEHESHLLQTYWNQGGRGLVLCELSFDSRSGEPVDTGIRRLLAEYAVEASLNRVVTRSITGQIEATVEGNSSRENHPLVRALPPAPVALIEPRSVRERIGVSRTALHVTPILVSAPAPDTWAEADLSIDALPNPDGGDDVPGPVPLAVAIERRQGTLHEPVLIVVGDSEFVDNHALEGPAGRSGFSFLLSAINWLQDRHELLGDIPPRRNEGYRLAGTAAQQRGLVWKPTLFLCALLSTIGTSVWVSRRRG